MQQLPEIIIGKSYVEKVLPKIAEARHSIDIIVYDWRLRTSLPTHPVTLFVQGLLEAQGRGVRVRAIVSSAALVSDLGRLKIAAKVLHLEKLMHAKMLLIDDRVAVVGSHNYTQSAFKSNIEISVCFELPYLDNDLTRYFKNLWSV